MYQKTNYGRISSGLIVWTNSLGQVSSDLDPVDLSDFQPMGGLEICYTGTDTDVRMNVDKTHYIAR